MKDEEIVWEKDGAEMMLVPAGSFEMGDHFHEGKDDGSELPVHRVELDGFYMDAYQVTVGQFKQFVEDSGYDYDSGYYYDRWDDVAEQSPTNLHPMIYVNWNDATAYAKWAGKRLPTEAEWEYSARGGLVGKRYSCGDEYSTIHVPRKAAGKDKWEFTAPVGSFKPNGYGIFDMPGNVWEWCQDSDKTKRVLRGGSWYNNPNSLRAATRYSFNPSLSNDFNGFRCVSGFPVAQQ